MLKGSKHSFETKRKLRESHLGQIPWNKGKKGLYRATLESRIKRSEAWRGDKNPSWKGGITEVNALERRTVEYKIWRDSVFMRDNYTCTECGVRSGNGKAVILNADHIKPWAYYKELRFELSNGRTLCKPCHKLTDTFAGKVLNIKRTLCLN